MPSGAICHCTLPGSRVRAVVYVFGLGHPERAPTSAMQTPPQPQPSLPRPMLAIAKSEKLGCHEIDQRLVSGRAHRSKGKSAKVPTHLPGCALAGHEGEKLIVSLDLLVGVARLYEDLDFAVARAGASDRDVRERPDEHQVPRRIGN